MGAASANVRPTFQLLQGGLTGEPVHEDLALFIDRVAGYVKSAVLAIRWASRRGEQRLWINVHEDLDCYGPIPGWQCSDPDVLAQWYFSMLAGDRSILVLGSRVGNGIAIRSWRMEDGDGIPQTREATRVLAEHAWWNAMVSEHPGLGQQIQYGEAWTLQDEF